MKKKVYQKPSMAIVALHQNVHLLEGSGGVEASRSGYGAAKQETWDVSDVSE